MTTPPGAGVHYGNPWQDAPSARDPLRRLRGHLVLPVTIWLAGTGNPRAGTASAGATASAPASGTPGSGTFASGTFASGTFASGTPAPGTSAPGTPPPPARKDAGDVIAETALTGLTISSVMLAQGQPPMLAGLVSPESDLADALCTEGATFVVHVLSDGDQRLAQHFAGQLPAPPGALRVTASHHGPVLAQVRDRMGCRTVSWHDFGWSLLVEAEVQTVETGPAGKGLSWYHGSFRVVS